MGFARAHLARRRAAPRRDRLRLHPLDGRADRWAQAIERLRERVPRVFAYFSNFYEGHAPASANKLKRLLGQEWVGPEDIEDQPSLF